MRKKATGKEEEGLLESTSGSSLYFKSPVLK